MPQFSLKSAMLLGKNHGTFSGADDSRHRNGFLFADNFHVISSFIFVLYIFLLLF
jgi:hypothetical protein